MTSFEFDNVKAEKEDALRRYNMEMKLRMIFRIIGFCLALFLLTWPWFPTLIPDSVEAAGDYRRRFVSAFNKPLITFVIVNIIIVVVYILSSQKQANSDVYDEYVNSRRSGVPASIVETAVSESLVVEETVVDKGIVLVENAAVVSSVKQSPTKTEDLVTETKHSKIEEKEYRRTRSMVSESRHRKPKDFRRSETAIGKEIVVSREDPPRKSMEEMSSEEFQYIIDSFIAERKKTLIQENSFHHATVVKN